MTTRHQRAAVAPGVVTTQMLRRLGPAEAPAGCHSGAERFDVCYNACMFMYVCCSTVCLTCVLCGVRSSASASTTAELTRTAGCEDRPARPSGQRGQAATSAAKRPARPAQPAQPARPRRGHAHGRVPPPAREAGAQVHAWIRRAHTHEGRACRAASADTPSDLYLF